ncbi:MAG: 4Fe-4S dicluster domain-containing protein [Nanobdellota archaeon]
MIVIDYEKCCFQDGSCKSCSCGGACTGCVEACPVNALSRNEYLDLDKEKCIGCGACINACKHGALSFENTL